MRFTSPVELELARAGVVAAVGGGGGGGGRGIAEVLGNWKDNPRASYPTQFTRDITPVCRLPYLVAMVVNCGASFPSIEKDTFAQ